MKSSELKFVDLNVSRIIDASLEDTFDCWCDPVLRREWFGAEHMIMNAPVVDGLFYIAAKGPDGDVYPHYGRFTRVERPRLLEQTWVSRGTKGFESVVTMSFEPKNGGTELTLRHTGVPDDQEGRDHEAGWTWVLEEFGRRVTERKK